MAFWAAAPNICQKSQIYLKRMWLKSHFLDSDFNQLLTESEFITIVIERETSEDISVEAVLLSEMQLEMRYNEFKLNSVRVKNGTWLWAPGCSGCSGPKSTSDTAQSLVADTRIIAIIGRVKT